MNEQEDNLFSLSSKGKVTINFNANTALKVNLKEQSIKKPEWRRKKILNPLTNKFVYEDSKIGEQLIKKERYDNLNSCKEGYRYDWRKEKCVKLTKKEVEEGEKRTQLKKRRQGILKKKQEEEIGENSFGVFKRCKNDQILNPVTKKCVKIDSNAGRIALQINYERQFWKFQNRLDDRFDL